MTLAICGGFPGRPDFPDDPVRRAENFREVFFEERPIARAEIILGRDFQRRAGGVHPARAGRADRAGQRREASFGRCAAILQAEDEVERATHRGKVTEADHRTQHAGCFLHPDEMTLAASALRRDQILSARNADEHLQDRGLHHAEDPFPVVGGKTQGGGLASEWFFEMLQCCLAGFRAGRRIESRQMRSTHLLIIDQKCHAAGGLRSRGQVGLEVHRILHLLEAVRRRWRDALTLEPIVVVGECRSFLTHDLAI